MAYLGFINSMYDISLRIYRLYFQCYNSYKLQRKEHYRFIKKEQYNNMNVG